ncbi:MAG: 30S ribosomal protein S6 [bacterium]
MIPYESMVIIEPGLTKEDADKLVDRYAEVIKTEGGEVTKIDRMGKRKLSYPMRKHAEGTYALLVYNAPPTAVAELERQMRLADEVLKFQSLKIVPEYKPVPRKQRVAAAAA